MKPSVRTGPKGGVYVLTTNMQKIYIPSNVQKWVDENGRWRIFLLNGTNMLLPKLIKY